MIRLKTPEDIEILKEGGKRLSSILSALEARISPGMTSEELNDYAGELFRESGGKPSFYKYAPRGSKRGFPAYICVSVNDVVVHGIPNENPITFTSGDIVSIDGGLTYKGLITDSARTVIVGEADSEKRKLVEATKEGLYAGIKAAQLGAHIGDIGAAIQKVASRNGLGIAEDLAGHGVGYEVHEDPYIPNTGVPGKGEELREGLVIALEPMFTLGKGAVTFSDDEYTVTTRDGSLSAHFEHTIAITKKGPIILTK